MEIKIKKSILLDIKDTDHTLYFCTVSSGDRNIKIELVSCKKSYKGFDLMTIVCPFHNTVDYYTKVGEYRFKYFSCSINKHKLNEMIEDCDTEYLTFYHNTAYSITHRFYSIDINYLDDKESYSLYHEPCTSYNHNLTSITVEYLLKMIKQNKGNNEVEIKKDYFINLRCLEGIVDLLIERSKTRNANFCYRIDSKSKDRGPYYINFNMNTIFFVENVYYKRDKHIVTNEDMVSLQKKILVYGNDPDGVVEYAILDI